MADVTTCLAEVRRRLRVCASRYGRDPDSVGLVAVSKRQPVAALRAAFAAGQRAFGENYLQEALEKHRALADLAGLEWHFIGAIQSNKTTDIAQAFDWVHTVDRARIAERLSARRDPGREPLNVLVQVNISGEASKAGVAPAELPRLLEHVAGLPRLRLRGLMALPAPEPDFPRQRAAFAALAALARAAPMALDTLSMGTSEDFEAAIAEGATLVRIGTAVFGPRAGA